MPAPAPMQSLPLPTSGALSTPAPTNAPGPGYQIATIRIPQIGLVAPLFEGISQAVLNQGPGHWPGTARPGTWGNVVVGGHRTTYSHPFLNVDWLRPGNQIIFNANGIEAVYAVTGTMVVPDNAMWIVTQTPGATVTLFSCHPKGSAAQRIVVRGNLVSLRHS
jgi:sortase A